MKRLDVDILLVLSWSITELPDVDDFESCFDMAAQIFSSRSLILEQAFSWVRRSENRRPHMHLGSDMRVMLIQVKK
jgi:hypothetical protein